MPSPLREDTGLLPADCVPYRRTATFTQNTIPAGLLRTHSSGVWALIHVLEGKLLYRVSGPGSSERIISPGDQPGVIEPHRLHEVAPLGSVRFYLEFHRRQMQPMPG